MRRIALGIDSWYPQVDGVTNVVVSYSKLMPESSVVIAPSYGAEKDTEGEEKYHAHVFHNKSLKVPLIGFRNSIPKKDKKLKKMLGEFKPEVLHAHSPFAISSYFHRYGKKNKIPVVYTFHTKFRDDVKRITKSSLITAIVMSVIMRNIKKADYVWAVSEYAAKALRDYGYKGEIKVMPNATDMPRISAEQRKAAAQTIDKKHNLRPGERVLMYAGRVVKVKNIFFSLRVIKKLTEKNFDCKFLVVGGGDDLKKHIKYATRLGIKDRVIFTGHLTDRSQLAAYYCRANMFLMPSTFDTYGLVVAEAAACGTPTITAENSSAAEIIEEGVSGFACPLDEDAWADRIIKTFTEGSLLNGDERVTAVAKNWTERRAEIVQAYEEVIASYKAKNP